MKKVEIEVKLNQEYENTKIVIYTKEMSDQIDNIISKLQDITDEKIIGYKNEEAFILEKDEIECVYSEDKKIYARANNEIYQIKKRIFELEKILYENNFVRTSNSEIVNFKKVTSMDFKITGTIILKLESGNITYTSRRYIKKIKEYLGL